MHFSVIGHYLQDEINNLLRGGKQFLTRAISMYYMARLSN